MMTLLADTTGMHWHISIKNASQQGECTSQTKLALFAHRVAWCHERTVKIATMATPRSSGKMARLLANVATKHVVVVGRDGDENQGMVVPIAIILLLVIVTFRLNV